MSNQELITSSINLNDGALKAYQQAGLKKHVKAVEEYVILQILNLPANTAKTWSQQLVNPFIIKSAWCYYPTGANGTVSFLLSANGATVFQLDTNTNSLKAGFLPPFNIIQSVYDFSVLSTVAIPALWIYCEEVSLVTNPISPII
jgi:hypothetical protein